MPEPEEQSMSMDGGRFYKKHRKQLGVRKNMQKFLGGFLNEAISDGNVAPTDPTDPSTMAGGMKRAAMKRAAMKRAAMKRAAMKKRTGGNDGEGQEPEVVSKASSQDGGKKRTPKYRKTGGQVADPPVAPISSVRSFLNQLSSGGGKKKVATPARRRVASPARRRVASPVRRRRRSASPVRRSLF